MIYLLYVNPLFPYGSVVAAIPAGLTPAEYATQLGLAPENWAAFDLDAQPAGTISFVQCLEIVNNLPAPNTVAMNLPLAKVYASDAVKLQASTAQGLALAGYSSEAIAGQAALAEIDRTPAIQAVIVATNALSDTLETNLAAIAAATTIDEVNNVVNPPTGIINIGRGAAGPLDLNVSEYTEFNSVSMTEAETELYIPSTSTVINYGEFVPNKFDSAGNCFTSGNYLIQIREVATSQVIAEFECPLAPANEDVAF